MKIRKWNKILWLFVLCLLFPVKAFSAAGTEVKIPVGVVLKNGSSAKDAVSEILLKGEENAPVPKKNNIKISGTGTGIFPEIIFTAPGVYEYTLWQKTENNQQIQYDKTRYYIKISVINGKSGELEASIAAYTDSRREGEKREICFVNTYRGATTPSVSPEIKTAKTVQKTGVQSVKTSTKPKTGDFSPVLMWIGLLGAAGLISVMVYIALKKKNR